MAAAMECEISFRLLNVISDLDVHGIFVKLFPVRNFQIFTTFIL